MTQDSKEIIVETERYVDINEDFTDEEMNRIINTMNNVFYEKISDGKAFKKYNQFDHLLGITTDDNNFELTNFTFEGYYFQSKKEKYLKELQTYRDAFNKITLFFSFVAKNTNNNKSIKTLGSFEYTGLTKDVNNILIIRPEKMELTYRNFENWEDAKGYFKIRIYEHDVVEKLND